MAAMISSASIVKRPLVLAWTSSVEFLLFGGPNLKLIFESSLRGPNFDAGTVTAAGVTTFLQLGKNLKNEYRILAKIELN